MRRVVVLALVACALPSAARAQSGNENFQLWTVASISAPVSDKVDATLDLHAALTEDASRANQYLVRPGLLWKVSDVLSLGAGYSYSRVAVEGGPDLRENRAFQQLGLVLKGGGRGLMIQTKTRLEERFAVGADGTNYRLRHQTRFDLPVADAGRLKLVYWNETFYSINSTAWAGPSGFTQSWNFVGVSLPLTKRVTAEPGYLNLTLIRPGRDHVIRVLGLFVTAKL